MQLVDELFVDLLQDPVMGIILYYFSRVFLYDYTKTVLVCPKIILHSIIVFSKKNPKKVRQRTFQDR